MIIGIDLGTTNSLVACWQDGRARLIPNSLGEYLTPSCVSLDKDGSVLVGRAARERLQTHPELSAAVFKRYMGSEKTLRLGTRDFRPEELSALVLRALKEDAENFLGQAVTEAIITVPAYFSDAQRKATRAAGKLAGLRVERLLNEPSAAALAYGMHLRGQESKFLVFDLGGGTFDVSVLDLFEGVMEVRSSAGDNFLGGEDVVQLLVDHVFTKLGLPAALRKDAMFMQVLGAQAEAAKRVLSEQPEASMRILQRDEELRLQITEAEFEALCAPLLARLREPVERALRDANLRSNELDNVVLAGGATRMPIVRRLVARMFGRFPAVDLNPDEVVALGAAVQAGLKMRDAALDEVVMTDVAPYSLGIETARRMPDGSLSHGHFDPLIERNTPVPVSRIKQYFPLRNNQEQMDLDVYQGEARLARDNIRLGRLSLKLPPGPAENNVVDVRFTYDVNGLLLVEAVLAYSGQQFSLVIEGNPGLLSEEEIAARFAALAELKIHPRDRQENRTLMARAERLYQQLRGEQRERFGLQITAFERLLERQDMREIAAQRTSFEGILDTIERQDYLQ